MLKRLKKNRKGFTLAELLIVVAIIGVLVAVSIPIFQSQLEKSRDAVTLSNIRSAYAEVQAAYLTQDTAPSSYPQTISQNGQEIIIKAPVTASGTTTQEVTISRVTSKGQSEGLANEGELPCAVFSSGTTTALDDMGKTPGDYTVTFTYTTTGEDTSVMITNAIVPTSGT